MSEPTLAHAIRCLEDELARQLDRAGAIALELRTLRELSSRDFRPAAIPPAGTVPAEPEPAAVASQQAGSGSQVVRPPATGAPADPVKLPATRKETSRSSVRAGGASRSTKRPPADSAPPAGIPRPESHDCIHCDKSFPTRQGLSVHIGRTHPIERTPFDPDKARAAAAAAMDGDGGISKMSLGRPKASAA